MRKLRGIRKLHAELFCIFLFCIGGCSSSDTMYTAFEATDHARGLFPAKLTTEFVNALPNMSPVAEDAKLTVLSDPTNVDALWVIRDELVVEAKKEDDPINLVGGLIADSVEVATPFLPAPYNLLAIGAAGILGRRFR